MAEDSDLRPPEAASPATGECFVCQQRYGDLSFLRIQSRKCRKAIIRCFLCDRCRYWIGLLRFIRLAANAVGLVCVLLLFVFVGQANGLAGRIITLSLLLCLLGTASFSIGFRILCAVPARAACFHITNDLYLTDVKILKEPSNDMGVIDMIASK